MISRPQPLSRPAPVPAPPAESAGKGGRPAALPSPTARLRQARPLPACQKALAGSSSGGRRLAPWPSYSPRPDTETRMSQHGITHTPGAGGQETADLRSDDLDAVRRLTDAFKSIRQQLSRIIVGQEQVIEELLISLFSKGHCILEGVPGLAKTLMISTLSRCLSLSFSRIQF